MKINRKLKKLIIISSLLISSTQVYSEKNVKETSSSLSPDDIQMKQGFRTSLSKMQDADEIYELFWGVVFSNYLDVANDFLQKAAKFGHPNAQENLAFYYYLGPEGHYDTRGMNGEYYYKGAGKPDYSKAFHWFTKAAENNSAVGQYYLGIMYRNGQGVPINYTKSAFWFHEAAKQGVLDAQYEIGIIYYFGLGVDKSYGKAVDWLRQSASKGYEASINALEELHIN